MSVHINRPSSTRFVGMVREHSAKNWKHAGHKRDDKRDAARDMLEKMLVGNYFRGRVLMTDDYYDPVVVMECKWTS